jgi:hypothetical protein
MLHHYRRFVRAQLRAIDESGHAGCFDSRRKIRTVEGIVSIPGMSRI